MRISYKYAVALTAALALFMSVLDATIVNVALTPMKNSFKTDLNSVQWVITSYFLAQAAIIPVAGYLANKLGSKKVFLASMFMFTLGSLLCGLSDILTDGSGNPQIGWLIFFRVVQGVGGGAMFPLATSIAFDAFPPDERVAASSVVGVPVLMAPALGPTIGGLLVDSVGWSFIFYINVPLGLLSFYLIWRVLKPDEVMKESRTGSRFDLVGLVLSMVAVLIIVYAFTRVSQTDPSTVSTIKPQGDIYGWGDILVWSLLGTGTFLLLFFGFYELKVAGDPVLDLRLFKSYIFSITSLLTWLLRLTIFGTFFLIPFFLETVRYPTMNAFSTGLTMLPMGLASAVAIALNAKLMDTIGSRFIVLTGMVLLIVSTFMLTSLTNSTDGWSLAPIMVLRGLGFGFTNIPLQTMALSPITGEALPKASSLYNVTAQIFSSIGVAIITTIFVTQITANTPDSRQVQSTTLEIALQQPAGERFSSEYLAGHTGMTLEAARTQPDFQEGLFRSILDPVKVSEITREYLVQKPGLSLEELKLLPEYRSSLVARATTASFRSELNGVLTSKTGVPALESTFRVVLWATVGLTLLVFLLPGRGKSQPEKAEKRVEKSVEAVLP